MTNKNYYLFTAFAVLVIAGFASFGFPNLVRAAGTVSVAPVTSTLPNVILGNLYSASSTATASSTNASDTFIWTVSSTPAWATVATTTTGVGSSTLGFTVSGTPNATGTTNLIFWARGSSSTALGSSTWTFSVNPATVTLTPATTSTLPNIVIGNLYSTTSTIAATSTDPGDTFTWSFSGKPAWLHITTSTPNGTTLNFTATGTPVFANIGTVDLIFTGTGASSTAIASVSFTFNVTAAVVTLTPATTSTLPNAAVNVPYSTTSTVAATSTDPGDTFTWGVTGAPAWATVATTTTGVGSSTLGFTVSGTPNATGTVALVFTGTGASSTISTSVAFTFSVAATSSLSALSVNAGTLTPTFAEGTLSYTDAVATDASSINITPTVTDASSTMTINGASATSGVPFGVSLAVGDNAVKIVVTASDASNSTTYTITVTRATVGGGSGGGGNSGGGGGGGGSYSNPYTVTINGGASQTNSVNVTLALTSVAGMNQMWISNDSSFATSTGTGWIPFQGTHPWTLTSGFGSKVVYVAFRSADSATVSGTASASIALSAGVGGGTGAGSGGASTLANAQLQALLDQLLAQLQSLIAQAKSQGILLPPGMLVSTFAHDLKLGMAHSDVKALQMYLNGRGFLVGLSGYPGSNGNETDYFGPATMKALAAFQASVGISPASGYFGPLTRTYINSHP